MAKKINSNRKGKVGELEFVHWLLDRGHYAERGVQYKGSSDSPDVITDLKNIHFEVKRTERLSLYEAFAQADRDAGEDKIPVVMHRRNRQPWLAIMDASHFLRMVEVYNSHLNSY